MGKRINGAALLLVILLAGCSTSVYEYQNNQPALMLEDFFSGHLVAHGLLKSRTGTVKRRFTATIDARWDGDTGWLDESFLFDDGEQQTRCWTLTKTDQGYRGTAGDVVGVADGVVAGNTLHWVYQLKVPVGGREWVLTLDDWLVLVDNDTLINTTDLKKWGFKVAELVLSIRREGDTPVGNFENCPAKN
ncbi:DUF3833 family protein [Halioxenophilus aromaticivorans]|uniref:DUF3833 domain-containing protein n=1 Tax=Halioxenophilus aromaticivorans TaxID=1306992 RepID=A0AAV3U5B8_9ALTE